MVWMSNTYAVILRRRLHVSICPPDYLHSCSLHFRLFVPTNQYNSIHTFSYALIHPSPDPLSHVSVFSPFPLGSPIWHGWMMMDVFVFLQYCIVANCVPLFFTCLFTFGFNFFVLNYCFASCTHRAPTCSKMCYVYKVHKKLKLGLHWFPSIYLVNCRPSVHQPLYTLHIIASTSICSIRLLFVNIQCRNCPHACSW